MLRAETGHCYVRYVSEERCLEAYHARKDLLGTHGVRISLSCEAEMERARAQLQQLPGRLPLGPPPVCLLAADAPYAALIFSMHQHASGAAGNALLFLDCHGALLMMPRQPS